MGWAPHNMRPGGPCPPGSDAANFRCHLDSHSRYATTHPKWRLAVRPTVRTGGCVMARELHRVKIAPKGMGLNDFVAMQEGFFAAEGLDVEFDWKTFRGTQSSWKDLQYFQRPQDRPYTKDKDEVIQGACVWGTICNASAGMGTFRGRRLWRVAVGDLRAAGFEDPPAGGSQGRADLGRHARRQPFQRAVSAGKISAARKHQDRQHRRLRRAPESAARRRGRGRKPAAAADRDGRAAWPAQDHRGHVPHAVVGAGRLAARGRDRLSARARSRREGDGCRSREISAAVEARGAGRIRDHAPVGFHPLRPRRALRLRDRSRARNSTR